MIASKITVSFLFCTRFKTPQSWQVAGDARRQREHESESTLALTLALREVYVLAVSVGTQEQLEQQGSEHRATLNSSQRTWHHSQQLSAQNRAHQEYCYVLVSAKQG